MILLKKKLCLEDEGKVLILKKALAVKGFFGLDPLKEKMALKIIHKSNLVGIVSCLKVMKLC